MFKLLLNKNQTTTGITNTAYKQLKTSFSDLLKGTNKTSVVSVSPPADDPPCCYDHCPTTGTPSPVPYRNEVNSTCCDGLVNPLQPEEDNRPADANNWEELKEDEDSFILRMH